MCVETGGGPRHPPTSESESMFTMTAVQLRAEVRGERWPDWTAGFSHSNHSNSVTTIKTYYTPQETKYPFCLYFQF